MELTDEELAVELARKKRQLMEKRKSDEVNVAAEKRRRLLLELSEINLELYSNSSSTSSSSSSSSSSSFSSSSCSSSMPLVPSPSEASPIVDVVAAPKPKNSMFTYWATKNNSIADVENADAQRVSGAKLNSESRQSNLHRERKVAHGSQNPSKNSAATRACSQSAWLSIRRKLSEDAQIFISYNPAEKRIWCSACICFVLDDNVEEHITTTKHKKAARLATDENVHQTSLENAIKISNTLSNFTPGKTHLFRCELVRTFLTAALPISKADDFRPFLEKWSKMQSTDSSNLLREYLPIIKVSVR